MTYKTSLDKSAMAITICVTILFAVIIGGQYSIIKNAGRAIPIYTTTACLLIYFLALGFRPISYVVTKEKIIVRRPLLNVHIKRTDIKSVELIERNKITGSIRTFGVGGLFGYYGNFANFSLGRMTWYATRKDKPVLVKTIDNKKIIFTPNEPDKFVNELNS
jgi:Bacterial PH domain